LNQPACLPAFLQISLAALLPCCLAALLPGCPAAWLPCCLAALLPGCPAALLLFLPCCLPAVLPACLPIAFHHYYINISQTIEKGTFPLKPFFDHCVANR
jgi:hypothetical protein